MINPPGESLTVEMLPEWTDLPNLGPRTNALMRENWQLINMASAIFNQDSITSEEAETLSDIWAQTLEIEREYAEVREHEWLQKFTAEFGIALRSGEAA